MTTPAPQWVHQAHRDLCHAREVVRDMLGPNEWPLMIFGDDVRFVGDDAEIPLRPPANDVDFTFYFD